LLKNKEMVKRYTSDELEELDLVECCAHCGNLDIKVEEGVTHCPKCNTVDYVKVMPMEDYIENQKVEC